MTGCDVSGLTRGQIGIQASGPLRPQAEHLVCPRCGWAPGPTTTTRHRRRSATAGCAPAIPKTAVGKFDKKVLRARLADGDLAVERISQGSTVTA
jgi:hypothetical protein